MLDVLLDTVIDCLKMLPILFLAYLLMEFLEQKAGEKINRAVVKVGYAGPVLGSALGIIPQCGFSSAVAGFYSAGVVTLGTLIAVLLSTSDEMLPILISSSFDVKTILKILIFKFVAGMVIGFAIDIILKIFNRQRDVTSEKIHDFCEQEHCECEENIFLSALKHTGKIILLVFIVSLALNTLFFFTGTQWLESIVKNIPVLGEMAAALIGLIPNCSSSVLITNLFVNNVISPSQMMAGLLANGGVGLLVLYRLNRHPLKNAAITVIVYSVSVLLGLLCSLVW